ncbi:2Fe-2S iron-sulfur cluster-binding protein [Sphingomonas profundi]|uniref:2Fe-2S iron-sulfur cluster-binding protein n=1 Tax=Alterirhizorhabdus profundi TaxID=2681549 RepID=UPI0012E70CA6|nr:2Fe-2S iron-sulfur cluster-binding protein [Sphingomonas profundi]
MAKIIFKQPDGESVDIDARNGFTLMEVAVNNGVVGIDGECGGGCSCATCHVYIDANFIDAIDPPTEYETDLLECIVGYTERSRLSCQVKVSDALDGILLTIPSDQGLA